jgi:hypothetical protein
MRACVCECVRVCVCVCVSSMSPRSESWGEAQSRQTYGASTLLSTHEPRTADASASVDSKRSSVSPSSVTHTHTHTSIHIHTFAVYGNMEPKNCERSKLGKKRARATHIIHPTQVYLRSKTCTLSPRSGTPRIKKRYGLWKADALNWWRRECVYVRECRSE